MATDFGLISFRFDTEELRFHLRNGHFPTKAEVAEHSGNPRCGAGFH